MVKFTIFVFAIVLDRFTYSAFHNEITPKCTPEDDVCSFDLTIARNETMVLFSDAATPLVIEDGVLYKRNCQSFPNDRLPVTADTELADVIIGDGTVRYVYTINGQFPGPSIVVYEGQTVRINVTNRLLQEGIGIHWHGIPQRGTNYMDGVPGVTQCRIGPQDSFLYEFIAEPVGTHWYHSHEGAQRSDGMFGAFVVLPKPNTGKASDLPQFANDYMMLVFDWYALQAHHMFTSYYSQLSRYLNQEYTDNEPCAPGGTIADGSNIGPLPFHSALINGKGVLEATNIPGLLEEFTVTPDEFYRFRVINTGQMFAFRVSIDGHKLTVFSSDGYEFEAREVDYVIVSIAERYDFYIRADGPAANYWIRAETLEESANHTTLGILHYTTSARGRPATIPRQCTQQSPCTVLNCPFRAYPANRFMNCINVGDLRSKAAPPQDSVDDERFLIFNIAPEYDVSGRPRSAVNGIVYQHSSTLTQDTGTSSFIRRCDPASCDTNPCACTHVQQLEKDQWVQMVLISQTTDTFAGFPHPVHLHGHHFWVVKVGYPSYDANSRFVGMSSEVVCQNNETTFCRFPAWSDPSWAGGKVPGLNVDNPVLKDTVQVPTGGYVVIRFKADNPGRWMMHCHMEIHLLEGMTLIIQEGTDQEMPEYPDYAPVCGSLQNLQTTGTYGSFGSSGDLWKLLFIIVCCVAGVLLIVLIIVIACTCRRGTCARTEPVQGKAEHDPYSERSPLLRKDKTKA